MAVSRAADAQGHRPLQEFRRSWRFPMVRSRRAGGNAPDAAHSDGTHGKCGRTIAASRRKNRKPCVYMRGGPTPASVPATNVEGARSSPRSRSSRRGFVPDQVIAHAACDLAIVWRGPFGSVATTDGLMSKSADRHVERPCRGTARQASSSRRSPPWPKIPSAADCVQVSSHVLDDTDSGTSTR